MKNNKLYELQALSDHEVPIEPYDYTCMIHPSYSQLIIGRDGSGKTSLALAQGVSYCIKRNITLLYINADAKSATQSNTFNNLFKDITETTNCEAYHLNYYSWKDTTEGEGKSFLEFVLMLADHQKDSETYFIVDNWSKIINGYESDTKKVGEIIDLFESKVSKIPNFTTVLLAHTGKDESLGARGMSSLRSVFGQEILIQVDATGNRTGTITKDSEGNFREKGQTYYIEIGLKYQLNFEICEHTLIDKDVIMYHKEQRLEKIVLGLLVRLRADDIHYIEYAYLKSLAAIQGSKDLSFADPDYLSASFCSRNIGYVLEKLNVRISKLKSHNNRNFIDVLTLKESTRDAIGFEAKVIDYTIYDKENPVFIYFDTTDKKRGEALKPAGFLEMDINELLELNSLSTQEIRENIYLKPSTENMKNYSKRYARDMIPSILDSMHSRNRVKKDVEGRKTTYSLIKENK